MLYPYKSILFYGSADKLDGTKFSVVRAFEHKQFEDFTLLDNILYKDILQNISR
jgi:hypothetical protein